MVASCPNVGSSSTSIRGRVGEHGRDREAALLAARERERVGLREAVEAEHAEQFVDAGATLVGAELEGAGADLEFGPHRSR